MLTLLKGLWGNKPYMNVGLCITYIDICYQYLHCWETRHVSYQTYCNCHHPENSHEYQSKNVHK